jgi:heterotetrameric sarcosine oxidase gamma subunit
VADRRFSPSAAPAIVAGGPVDAESVTIRDLSHLSVVLLRWRPGSTDPDIRFGSSIQRGEVVVSGIRPDEAMVIGPPEQIAQAVAVEQAASVVDVSHGRCLIEIGGVAAAKVLEKVCSLDWSDSMTPNGAATSASVAKVVCDIVRADDGRSRYLVACGRSYGQYLFDCLADAAAEFR